ncbi:MAG: M1 family metallopeptidase [Bryobacteraceae bacterium]
MAALQSSAQPPAPVNPAAAVTAALKELAYDPAKCWRVRDLALAREDIKIYLTDGFVMLSKPLGEAPVSALFWAEVEGGDGEIILLPPSAGERQSLARFTESPNLAEHFKSAALIFTDGTAAEIEAFLRASEASPAPEMGALLADQFSPTLRNLTASFEARIVQDVGGKVRPEYGLFFAALAGSAHGNFDAIHDPQATDQIVVAQIHSRENRPYYNVWTSFPSRRVRKDAALAPPLREFQIEHVKIEASLALDLRLTATTTLRIRVPADSGLRRVRNTLAFDISRRVRVREASVDGAPAQVLQRENLRSSLLRGSENEVFLVAMADGLAPGEHTVAFQQEGEVIVPAGNGVYFVNARGTWYPHHGLQFATYEMTFRCPKNLSVIATGDLIDERVEGDMRVTRRRSAVPLRIAGFNLGEYKRSSASRGGLRVDVYANRAVEASLAPRRQEVMIPPPAPTLGRQSRPPNMQPVLVQPAPPDPAAQIELLAAEVAEAFEFLAARFGPPPLKTLAVSPIPGTFGQGFPGLIYLSTLAYLTPRDRPQFANHGLHQVFFSDILVAHEVAHQWWGNTITTAGYRDEWMMEALANYSALLLLERKRGVRALEDVLEKYRDHLLEKGVNGQSIDSAGPIQLGSRLETSQTPEAFRAVIYEKGTWIVHMLRRRLGDAAFFNMLRELHTRFLRGRVTTADLRRLSAGFQPKGNPDPALEQFFASYVEGVGIPSLRMQSRRKPTAKGVMVTVDLEQSGVGEDFAVDVPVELDFGRGRSETRWIRTAGERASVEWTLAAAPVRVQLDPRNSLLALKP